MARSPESAAKMKTYSRELYRTRKAEQVCVYCGGDLDDEEDDAYACKPCLDERRPRGDTYRYSDHGRAVRRKNQDDYIKRRMDAGLCLRCMKPRDKWPAPRPSQVGKRAKLAALGKFPQFCPDCSESRAAYHRRRDKLKREGVLDLVRARRLRELEEKKIAAARALEAREHQKRADSKYQPADELIASTRYRLLSTIVRFDWFSASDLFDALGLPSFDVSRIERDRFAKSLERYVKRGLIRYRTFHASGSLTGKKPIGLRNGGTYKITEDGRAALADLKREIAKGAAC